MGKDAGMKSSPIGFSGNLLGTGGSNDDTPEGLRLVNEAFRSAVNLV